MALATSLEVTTVPDDDAPRQQPATHDEAGVEVPTERLNPETLRNLIAEFVTREWSDSGPSLDTQIDQVLKQLRTGQAKIVFDTVSQTCNIVPSDKKAHEN